MPRRVGTNFAGFAASAWLAATVGCHRETATSASAAAPPPANPPIAASIPASAPVPTPGTTAEVFDASLDLAPLHEPAAMVDLQVAAASQAKASVPLDTVRPRPTLIALHGNFDRPEWTCEIWSYVADNFPFVLCPRGTIRKDAPGLDRWTYPGSTAATREMGSVLDAARERWSAYVLDGPSVYAGFSLGAILGVPIVAADAAHFPRVILVEGGHDGWTDARAGAFAAGAKSANVEPRVLFVCAQSGCTGDAEKARKILTKHGVGAKIVSAGNVGHQYGGVVAETTKKNFGWVVEGMPGWSSD